MDDTEQLRADMATALAMIEQGPCRYVDVRDALSRSDSRAGVALRRLEVAGEIHWRSNGWLTLPRRRIHPARDSQPVPLFDDEHPGPARGTPGDARAAVRSDAAAGGRGA